MPQPSSAAPFESRGKLRVAMLAAGDVFGGAERQMVTLCRAGAPLFEGVIFQSAPGPLALEASRAAIGVRTELVDKGLIAAGVALARCLQSESFDLIHSHGYRGSALAAIARIAGCRLPVVRTMHGAPESGASKKMALYQQVGDVAGRLCRAHPVYVSHDLRRKLTGDHDNSFTVIYNGVQSSSARPQRPLEYRTTEVNLLVAGRLEPVKGITHAITALHSRQLPQNTHLHIVGEGPERSALEQKVMREGLSGRVHFHGFRNDVLGFIAHADLLLLPSLHEGIPYVLLEALSLGTPVVATNVGGIPEVVYHGHEALLVPSHAPLAMAVAVAEILGNPALRERLSENGRTQVNAHFSAEVMAQEYYRLYQRVAARQAP